MLSEELKVGDKVVINTRVNTLIGVVTEITKGGNIRVGNTLYKPDGYIRGGGSWSFNYITKATDKDIKKIAEGKVINKCLVRLRGLKNISYEQALQINKILDL